MPRSADAHRFLITLWGRRPPGKIQIWELDGRRSTYLDTPDTDRWLDRPDVYVGVALCDRDLGRHRRARAEQTTAIAGLWADIDVNGGPERKQGAAPDMAQALALANELATPTIIVSSGYGIQAWWCFDRVWRFATAIERTDAAVMAAQWQQLLRAKASEWGFGLDSTHDLARLLRLPGTVNGKGGGRVPVELLACDGRVRYDRHELRERCKQAGDVAVTIGAAPEELDLPVVDVGPARALPTDVVQALIANSPEFARTWTHARREQWSMSEYDLALCSIAAQAGLTDQQLADLIALHRRTYDPSDTKGQRLDYVRRTVAKARQRSERQAAIDRLRQVATETRRLAA